MYGHALWQMGTLSSRALCNNNYTDAIVDVTPDGVTIVGGDKPGTGGYLEEGGLDIEGTVSVPYVFTDEANTVRLFYWDGETQANLNDGIILTME